MNDAFRASVQPVVLVGGRSSRFGRDKLREPHGGGWLVDAPIAALRGVFGPRVKLVGACHAGVAARGEGVIEDRYPGAGPIGGLRSALEAWDGPVFVLPGDLPGITPRGVSLLMEQAGAAPVALAVVAGSDRQEPCVGLYFPGVRDRIARHMDAGRASLHDLLTDDERRCVRLPPEELVNVNRPADLPLR